MLPAGYEKEFTQDGEIIRPHQISFTIPAVNSLDGLNILTAIPGITWGVNMTNHQEFVIVIAAGQDTPEMRKIILDAVLKAQLV